MGKLNSANTIGTGPHALANAINQEFWNYSMTTEAQPNTKAKLGLFDTVSLLIGIIVGVGIYKNPGLIFGNVPNAWIGLLVWVVGGLISLVGAFCFAELASTFPRSGGEYVYLSKAYGNGLGFLFAWAQLAVIRTGATIAVLAWLMTDFVRRCLVVPEGYDWVYLLIPCATIAVLTFVNILGVQIGKGTQNFLTVLKILCISAILLASFLLWSQPTANGVVTATTDNTVSVKMPESNAIKTVETEHIGIYVGGSKTVSESIEGTKETMTRPTTASDLVIGQPVTLVYHTGDKGGQVTRLLQDAATVPEVTLFSLWNGISLSMIFVLWTYSGWHEGAYVVAELKEDRKTIPAGLMIGTMSVMALYLIINGAYLLGLGFPIAAHSSEIAADLFGLLFGESAVIIISLLVIISTLGAIHGSIFTSSRIFPEMALDHPLFKPLAQWHARLNTPVVSLVVQALVSIVYILLVGLFFDKDQGFEVLLQGTAGVFWFFFLLTGISVFVLRKKYPDLPRSFRVPLYPWTALLFCLACAGMMYASISYKPWIALIGFVALLSGLPLYFLSRGIGKKL